MGPQLDLGRYSFRDPSKSQEIRVGSFYRRRKANQSNQNSNSFDAIDGSEDWSHKSKRIALDRSQLTSRNHARDSLSSDSNSFESSNGDAPGLALTDVSGESTQLYHQSCQSAQTSLMNTTLDLEKTQTTSDRLLIDTQITESTHESLCVDLNPDDYSAQSAAGIVPNPQSPIYFGQHCELSNTSDTNLSFARNSRKKVYPKRLPYENIMSHVVFVMSGFENPRRAILRDMAIAMGAKYSARWNKNCTHLL